MRRRDLLRTVAVAVLGGTAAGRVRADEDPVRAVGDRFDGVTTFVAPERNGDHDAGYVRLYDADAETLTYVAVAGSGDDAAVSVATRDAADANADPPAA
jgi:hypothetical protein